MPSLTAKQNKELTKLAVLTLLSEESLYEERGASPQIISRELSIKYDERDMFASVTAILLPEMIDDGLIRREETPGRPHFITEHGREYLEAARHQALFPELEQRRTWAEPKVGSDLQGDIAGVIRSLPEFRESNDQRIQQVSQQLAQIMGRTAAR